MAAIKAFLAKDSTKVFGGIVWAAVATLIGFYVHDVELKIQILSVWTGVGTFLGFVSGGTSNARSDASNAATNTLQSKGVLPPG